MVFTLDVNENQWSKKVLEVLLLDRTTKRNIIWATTNYEELGEDYNQKYPVLLSLITEENSEVIQPRVLKKKEHQGNRTKEKAEVFTPSWMCNEQNNSIDEEWFGRQKVFNVEKNKSWKAIVEKVEFPNEKNKTWQNYVDERRLEVTCGEAPYLVSRYDSSSGILIDLKERIGLLDRKLRIVNENAQNESEWLKWSERAFQSIYGFEFQGDNLLIARENLLITFCEYMEEGLKRTPTEKELIKIANIISWNIWQMDGLTYTIPYQEPVYINEQLDLFKKSNTREKKHCLIKDWRAKKILPFKELL